MGNTHWCAFEIQHPNLKFSQFFSLVLFHFTLFIPHLVCALKALTSSVFKVSYFSFLPASDRFAIYPVPEFQGCWAGGGRKETGLGFVLIKYFKGVNVCEIRWRGEALGRRIPGTQWPSNDNLRECRPAQAREIKPYRRASSLQKYPLPIPAK